MSINIIDKKNNKRKKKKRNEMPLEEYVEKNHLNLNLSINYENSPEKEIKSDTNSNSNESPKFEKYYINKSYSRLNPKLMKQNSNSTNNSSTDDDIKEKDKDFINNKFEKAFMQTKISNNINKGIKEYKQNNNNNYNNNCYTYPNQNVVNMNKNLYIGVKEYYTNIDENNNNNLNRIDKAHANIYINNYQNIMMNNYLTNMNLKYYICINSYKCNITFYSQKIKEIEKNLEETKKEIKLMENTTLSSMLMENQRNKLIDYIKKKINITTSDNNDIKFCQNLNHPYYYTNHDEEIRVKKVLFLIEGLFLEDHLKKNYFLIQYLNRDGYATLTQLEKCLQKIELEVDYDFLKKVFMEHRQNEVTETVETFDDILIRNKDWKNIRKRNQLDYKKIEQNLLNEVGQLKIMKIKNLIGKKSELVQIKDRLCFQYHVNIQRLKECQANFNINNNNIYNIYNNLNNYFYFKNNNIYNNNYTCNQKRFNY